MSRIYLDHAATSPLRPEARAAMEEGFGLWANPSSPHAEGRKARAALEDARERCKKALGWDGELIFTSGASEAAALAIIAAKVGQCLASAIEHDSVLSREIGIDRTLRVSGDGEPHLGELAGYLDPTAFGDEWLEKRSLVAIQHVNSETGTIQDLAAVAAVVHQAEGLLLCDCAQSAGKLPLPAEADMLVVSAHKFGGPIGIGALLVRDFAMLEPGGGHERGYRRGTENLPDALGMAAALEAGDWATTAKDRDDFAASFGDSLLRAGDRVDYILPLIHPGMRAQALLIRLDAMGFAVSAGSACSSGSLKPSRVLKAFGIPDDVASRTIRISLGWSTTPQELDAFVEAWRSLL